MRTVHLLKRNLTYYWRTNFSVIIGVAVAVAVLAGALLVGDSVRASLRDLFLQRLGKTDYVVSAPAFFRDRLATEIEQSEGFKQNGFISACPMIVLRGSALHEVNRRQGGQIIVYGVDERFWQFHDLPPREGFSSREVLISQALAEELGTKVGDALLVRIDKPTDIPVESLHGRKEDQGRTLRLTVRETLPSASLGEFSLYPQQASVRAVFISLPFLQKELDQTAKLNTILIAEDPKRRRYSEEANRRTLLEKILQDRASLEDLGVLIRVLPGQAGLSVETESRVLNNGLADAANKAANQLSLRTIRVLSYLANTIKSDDHSIPYSLVTAIEKQSFSELSGGKVLDTVHDAPPPIILNEWAGRDLAVKPGDSVSLEYYLWQQEGHLETRSATFRLAAIVPISGMAADRNLVPEYPGITETQHLSDWDPPFPIDLTRVRKRDEDYWDQYRTTPKAFVQLEQGQELWQSRFGKLTSIRLISPTGQVSDHDRDTYARQLRARLYAASMGFQVISARAQGLAASRGATDFGEYFLYFSFFLVIAALLLTVLFFRLGIEQRVHEIGTLEAIGFSPGKIRNLFLGEGVLLAVLGSLLGLAGAIVYGYLLMLGLKTWWVDAVGTTMLRLQVSWLSMAIGAVGGIVASVICIALTLRRLRSASTRSLLTGNSLTEGERAISADRRTRFRFFTVSRFAFLFGLLGITLLIDASFKQISQVAGFFGGGTSLLVALLCYQSVWLRQGTRDYIHGSGWKSVSRLGFRNATYRPARSMLCIALIASAVFIIVAVDSFRRENSNQLNERQSGAGGFPLLAESIVPLVHNPNTDEGREALNLLATDNNAQLKEVRFARFRLRAGDDASCLNLYQPRNPRILAPTDDFLQENRFSFQDSLARTSDEKANPWLLLNDSSGDAIPVIGDANSLTYVLHLKLGDELVLNESAGPKRLRIVGALSDSLFQSELLMSERNFLRLFPQEQGYKFFLIETPGLDSANVAGSLEDRLSDYGFNVVPTSERLAQFHRVENTYLSTFQLLGGLGLVLGTLGMAAVLFRNVLERRRELALLRAVGYNSSHFTLMVVAENGFLLFCGLATGTVCALLAVAPVFFSHGHRLPNVSLGVLLLLVLISGLIASLVATIAAVRSPLIPALKTE